MVSIKALILPVLLASANAALLPRDMITIVGYDGNNPNSVTAFTTALVSYTPVITSMPLATVSMSPTTVTMSPTTVNMTMMSSTTVTMMSSTTVNTTMMLPTTITMPPTTVTMSPTTSTLTTATFTNGTTSSITSTVTMAMKARNTGAYENGNEEGYSSPMFAFTSFSRPPSIINWPSNECSTSIESHGGFPKHSSTKAYDVEVMDGFANKETIGYMYHTTTAVQSGHHMAPQTTPGAKEWNVIQPSETTDVSIDMIKSMMGGHAFPTGPSLQARDVVSVIVFEGPSGNALSTVTTTSIGSDGAGFTTTATDIVYLVPVPSTVTAITTATTTAAGSVSMSTTTASTTATVTAMGPVSMSTITVTTPRMTTYTTSTTATVAATNNEQLLYTYSTVLPYQEAILAKNNASGQLQAIGGLVIAIGTLVLAFVL